MATTTTTKIEETHAVNLRDRLDEARTLVRRNVYWAMGAGVVPLPIVDMVGITAVQVKMLKQLGDLYEISFAEHKVKNIVTSLIAGLGATTLGRGLFLSLLKLIPVVGQTVSMAAMPITAGAITHAVGHVFIQHFEAGGTFLDFDPGAVRDHFRREFEAGKETVSAKGSHAPSKA